METPVEQLIQERTFSSLSEVELLAVNELCETEEEFQTMKAFFMELDTVAVSHQTIIHPEIKNSLDAIYAAKYPGIKANWTAPETPVAQAARIVPFYQKTWVRVAAVGLLLLGTVPFWNLLDTDLSASSEKKLMAKLDQPVHEETANSAAKTVQPTHAPTLTNVTSIEPISQNSIDKSTESVSGIADYKSIEPGVAVGTYSYSSSSEPESLSLAFSSSRVETKSLHKTIDLFNASTGEGIGSFSTIGRNADLYPNDMASSGKKEINAVSLAEEPDDLLDFLVPAF